MNRYSSRKVMIIISVITVVLLVFMMVSVAGCGRRIARAKAIADLLSEESDNAQDADDAEGTEAADESDSSSSSQQQGSDEDDTSTDTSAEDSTIGESVEDVQDNGSSQEDNGEENTENGDSDDDNTDSDDIEETEEYTANMPYVLTECGNIWEDEAFNDNMLVAGDTGIDNKQSRAYISFDITDLAGATIIEVLLHGEAFEKKGKPFATYGPMIVKAVYWGPNPINASMFNIDGVEIKSLEAQNFGIGNNNLKNDLQNVANSGGNRYQVMLYFEMDEADGDGEADYIMYDIGAAQITLDVTYTK